MQQIRRMTNSLGGLMGIVNKKILVIISATILLPLLVEARANACQPISDSPEWVGRFTNYAPSVGGINGRCGRSASGLDACAFTLESYLRGSGTGVMAAVPQRGGTSHLFGGAYRARALENALSVNGCVRVIVGDRYGRGSNNRSKMDIVTERARSPVASAVNRAQGELVPLGRAPGIRIPNRKVNRAPAAVSRASRSR
jgi:hypothetical protein